MALFYQHHVDSPPKYLGSENREDLDISSKAKLTLLDLVHQASINDWGT